MTESKYPRIHLTIDNCFAIKRWVKPEEWARIIREEIGGITCVQASTDLEIDLDFCPPDYVENWIKEVKRCEEKYGIKLVSFYSGYATYRSVNLLNWDKSYRDRFRDVYIFGTIDMAQELNANAGATLQAFSEEMLQDPKKFAAAEEMLLDYAVQSAKHAKDKGILYGFEQMYTPTQGLWRIKDVKKLIRNVYKHNKAPLYTTIDTAHMAGQAGFYMPSDRQFEEMINSRSAKAFRLPDEMKFMISKGTTLAELKKAANRYEYWFSNKGDEDLFCWLQEVSCYSPIMHMQQTDGSYSAHRPFTEQYNKTGIVNPKDVLEAIVKCYDKSIEKDMPPRAQDIYLAFELFFGVTDTKEAIISAMKESVSFWRDVIKQDGKQADYWL